MTLSLKQRLLSALRKPLRRYAGHRTLEDVIATAETLQRQRGDLNDSAVRVADLDDLSQAILDYHLDTVDHHEPGDGTTWPPEAHTHPISDVTGLTTALDGKVDVAGDTMTGGLSVPNLTNVDYIDFDTGAGVTVTEGQLAWNADEGTLDLGMGAGGATQQIGLETYFHVKADSTITDGQVVMATGAVGASGKITAAPATGLAIDQAQRIIGIATQTIATGDFGYVTCFGMVRSINTSAWAEGTILYYDPTVTGGLTATMPTAPNPKVTVAMVTRQGVNGTLMVRVDPGSVLGATDSNVQLGTLANRDFLIYNSVTARWENDIPEMADVNGLVAALDGKAGIADTETISGAWTFTTAPVIEPAAGNVNLDIKSVLGSNTAVRFYEAGYLRALVAFNGTSENSALSAYDAAGANGQSLLVWTHNGAVSLRHAGVSTYRFETTATGAKSFGGLDAVNGYKENGVSLTALYHRQNRGATINGVRVLDAAYVGTYNVSAQETMPTSVFFSPDGSRMFIYGQQADRLKCYDLATAWTITSGVTYNAALDSTNFNTAHSEATGQAVFIKEDGTKFWIVGTAQNTVYQYTMSTAWDPSTGTYDSKSLAVGNSGAETNTTGLAFSTDGTKMFTVGNVADSIYRFDMSTAWDVSTASTTPSQTLSIASQETSARGVRFTRDGRKMYVIGTTGDDVNEYLLTTAWDLSTATFQSSLSLSAASFTVPQDVFVSMDGRHLYAVDSTAQRVAKYLVPSDGLEVIGPIDVTGLLTARNGVQSKHPWSGVGYTTGAGGTGTQAGSGSKSTTVYLNKVAGKITMDSATLNAGASVTFILSNTTIGSDDVVVANLTSSGTTDSYTLEVGAITTGSCRITLRNTGAVNLSESLVINFVVIKGAAA